jgi:hypothetical protein
MVYQVAEDLGVAPSTIYRYKARSPAIAEAIWEQDERVNDIAESGLIAALGRGEAWAVCFRLKTKAKHRGYIERVEQDTRSEVIVRVVYV